MNKRIARKVLSVRQKARRDRLWRLRYGPEHGPWPIEKKAVTYLRRRQTPYRRTMRIVAAVEATPGSREAVLLLCSLWDEHRPYLWRAVRGGRWIRGRPIEGETIEAGRAVGEEEVARWRARGDGTSLVELVTGTLAYFADRWCVSRVGRMDAMVDHLRRLLPS